MTDKERLSWFTKRTGQRVWRTRAGLIGPAFDQVHEEGFLIRNKFHAEYLVEKEDAFSLSGEDLKHFSTRAERDLFEDVIQPHPGA